MTLDARSLACACVVATLGQLHPNISIGGTDASSNAAGVQARWEDAGVFAGVFVGGTTIDAVADGNLPEGPSALVLAVADRSRDAGLLTYLWTPRLELTMRRTQTMPGSAESAEARALFQRAAARFEGMHGAAPTVGERTPRAKEYAPTPMPPRGERSTKARGAGSTLTGLPAISVDSRGDIVQAGWLDGTRRYGVLARGRWRMAGPARMTSSDPGDWLVAFELDQNTGRTTLLQAVHGAAGIAIGHSVDGDVRALDANSSAWVARALEWLDRERARHSAGS